MSLASLWRMCTLQPEPPGPAEMLPHHDFKLCRLGYAIADVDDLLGRMDTFPDSEEGRRQTVELASKVRFHLARKRAYDPVQVDAKVDEIVARATRQS